MTERDRECGLGAVDSKTSGTARGALFPLVMILVLIAALLIGGRRAFMQNRQQGGAMALNGADYESSLGDPVAYVQEYEAGFSTSQRCTVLYPLRMPGSMKHPGLEINIDPPAVTLNQDLSFGPNDAGHGVEVSYSLRSGHDLSRGVMLSFSSLRPGGSCTIRFERLDLGAGGRIKGELLRATLYGFREGAESGETSDLEEPRKLELTSFPFDAALETQEQALLRRP